MQRSYVNSEGRTVHLPFGFHVTNALESFADFLNAFDKPPLSVEAKKRFQWIDYHKRGHTISLTCRHFNIPRKTFYLWYKRYQEAGTVGLEDLDRTPKRKRQRKCTPLQEERIVALRKDHIRWGKEKLADVYKRTYGESIASWQIQKVIEKYRLYYNPKKTAKIASKRKKSINKKRITELKKKPRTGYLVCIDTVVIYWNSMKRYIFTAVDHYSKLAFARMYTTKSSRNAKDFLLRLNHLMDGRIININRDNGSEFKGEFDKALTELQIQGYFSRVKTPKDNAVNERFNRTIQEEFIDLGNFSSDPEVLNKRLLDWLIEYNFERPHQTLGYKTPIEMACGKDHLLPMYSSSTETCVI
jgi:transposase InsO family protein